MFLPIITNIAIGWFIASFPLFEAFIRIVLEWLRIDNKVLSYLFVAPFTCVKCATFWFTLFTTFDPGMACICSLSAYILEKYDII